ncbi:colicin-like pore-forming protein [Enterobacter sp. BRE11]|nr:colicin-like pore-forming protein [Enterobacter sp. BRE11]
MQPGLYFGYIVDDYGNVVGQFPVGTDDANGQDLGSLSARGNNGGIRKDAPLQGPGPGYTGDQSEARIARLKETIRKNYTLAHSTQSGNRIYKARQDTLKAQRELASINYSRQQKAQEALDLQDGIKLVADFYSELTGKYGQQAAALAQELAEQAKGKTIRNVDNALVAYDRYRSYLGAKFSAADRAAILNALNSVDMARMASQLSKMLVIMAKQQMHMVFSRRLKEGLRLITGALH